MLSLIREKHRQLELIQKHKSLESRKQTGKKGSSASPITHTTGTRYNGTPSAASVKDSTHKPPSRSESTLIRSKSGKVQVMQHSPISNHSVRSENLSARKQLQGEVNNTQTSRVLPNAISEDGDSIGSLTPLSIPTRQDGRMSRLVSAKQNNRILTARANLLNEQRAPSRLLTAESDRNSFH